MGNAGYNVADETAVKQLGEVLAVGYARWRTVQIQWFGDLGEYLSRECTRK